MAHSGDLSANGALLAQTTISGNQINIATAGDITNSNATIQGCQLVNLA